MPRTSFEARIPMIISLLKNNENMPFTIQTSRCYMKNSKKCKKHHGEIVVESYNQKSNQFQCYFYGRHVKGIVFITNLSPEDIAQKIINSFRKKIILEKTVLKRIGYSVDKKITFHIYMPKELKARLLTKANEKGINLNQYIISRLNENYLF